MGDKILFLSMLQLCYVIDDRVPTCMWHVTHGRCAMASDEADPFKKKIKSMAATTNICSYS